MRYPFKNGNGCKCDACGKILEPSAQIQIKGLEYHTNEEYKSGRSKVIANRDMCPECFYNLMKNGFPYYQKNENEAISIARENSGIFNKMKVEDLREWAVNG